jgi:hypothetical protein
MLMALFRLSKGHQILSMTRGIFHLLAIIQMQAYITVLGSVCETKKSRAMPGFSVSIKVFIEEQQ